MSAVGGWDHPMWVTATQIGWARTHPMPDRPDTPPTILIAYDGSRAAREAVVAASNIVVSARLLVVTVWEAGLAYASPAVPAEGIVMSPVVEPSVALEVDRGAHADAERVAREGAELARSLGLDARPLAVPDEGTVARTLLAAGREHEAAAIVVGSRGLGGVRARLEGSTSKSVLKHADCPVIVVHDPDEDRD